MVTVFTLDEQNAPVHLGLEADPPVPSLHLATGFQGIVQQVHQQGAQIPFGHRQLFFHHSGGLKRGVLLPGLGCGRLQDGIDAEIMGVADGCQLAVGLFHLGQLGAQCLQVSLLIQQIQQGDLMPHLVAHGGALLDLFFDEPVALHRQLVFQPQALGLGLIPQHGLQQGPDGNEGAGADEPHVAPIQQAAG